MADTEDLEDLDEELARLEAELAALEGDERPKKKKGASALSSLKDKLPGTLPFKRSDSADDPDEADDDADGSDEPPTEGDAARDAPASDGGKPRKRLALPLLGGKKDAENADADASSEQSSAGVPKPEGFEGDASWDHDGPRWRRAGRGPSDGDVVLRRVDLEGNVVEEAPTDDPDVVKLAKGDDSEASSLRKRLGLPAGLAAFRRGGGAGDGDDPPAGGDADDDDDNGDGGRRRKVLIPVIAVAAIALLALVLPALAGVDPTGLGARLGIGAGGDAIQPDIAMTPGTGVAAAGDDITFDASGTTDEAGRDLVFSWDMGDGTSYEGARVRHAYASAGEYTVTLTVTAGRASAEATRAVTVLTKPVASVGVTVNGAAASASNPLIAGEPVTLSGADSTADGAIAQYQWTTSDGGSHAGATATHTFAAPGMHTITLTVTDDAGLTAQASQMVHVGWRGVFNDTAPASLEGASSGPAHPFTTNHGGMTPARVVLELAYAAPQAVVPGQSPPGGELTVSVADADGALVGEATGTNGTATLEITDAASFSLGEWTATVKRDQGAAEAKQYEVTVTVAYPPFM